ncbi:MAG: hypothetical protein GY850_05580 [bacterium]|nr:hypothetical protein [bacterium]
MHNKIYFINFFTCLSLMLGGCTGPGPENEMPANDTPAEKAADTVTLTGDDIILARVNGSPITEFDLELSIRKALGEMTSRKLDADGRDKVLQSLAAGRAIAQLEEGVLTAQEKLILNKKVLAYREELLVLQYLSKHSRQPPVTEEMIQEYYQANPELFGGKTVRQYEMIFTSRKLKTEERDAMIRVLGDAENEATWRKWAETLKQQGYPITYRQGEVNEKILHPQLQDLIRPLKKGRTSRISLIKGNIYVVRIVDEKQVPPRDLSEVRTRIRKALGPVQLKKAVKEASKEALENAVVEYLN